MSQPPADRPPNLAGRIARALGPWVVAVVALGWVMRKVHWGDLADAMRTAPLGQFVAVSVAMLVLNCAADTLAMKYTFRLFGTQLPYRELFIVRAATYVIAVVQYYLGQAALLGYLHNRHGVPLLRAAGWVLFVSGINLGVLLLLAAVGITGTRVPLAWLRYAPAATVVAAVAYAALIKLKPAVLARTRVLSPLFEAGVSGHVLATVVRLPHVMVLIVWHYYALRTFRIEIPFFDALVLLPVFFFAAALPVSAQGLGVAQFVAVVLFSPYAAAGRPAVLAYSLSISSCAVLIQVAMGLVFLPAGRKLGMREQTPPPGERGGDERAAA